MERNLREPTFWWECHDCLELAIEHPDRPSARREATAHADRRGHNVQIGGPI